jgi:hypothetical protein
MADPSGIGSTSLPPHVGQVSFVPAGLGADVASGPLEVLAMLSVPLVFVFIALILVVAAALGKAPDWTWGIVLCLVLLLMLLGT